MTEQLAIFRSRAQATDCYTRLKAQNLMVALVSTPKEANVGCGLSVLFSASQAARVKRFIAISRYSAFYGYLPATGYSPRSY
jgi:hypothetical protein